MSDFRKLSDTIWASPQISLEDVGEAARLGFAMIVNNRPDGETEDQPDGAVIEAAALAAGMVYRAIPVTHAGFSEAQVSEMTDVVGRAEGPVLAYCRSGTRSTLLWALAKANTGADPEDIARSARAAGYDVGSVRAAMDMLAEQADR